jgi:hypothetical protein
MMPCAVFILPHNGRDELYQPADGPSTVTDYEPGEERRSAVPAGAFVDLSIPMPKSMMVHTGPDGRPLAIWTDCGRIRWRDLDTVLAGVFEYNADLARQGIRREPHAIHHDTIG